MDVHTIPPAGDPFTSASRRDDRHDPAPHGCYGGRVFIGHLDVDPETGDELEVVVAVPCRRCNAGDER